MGETVKRVDACFDQNEQKNLLLTKKYVYVYIIFHFIAENVDE